VLLPPRDAKEKPGSQTSGSPCSSIPQRDQNVTSSPDDIAHTGRDAKAPLVLLAFIRAHVAAALVLFVRTRLASLIGRQLMTLAVGATTRVAGINRRASREQRDSLRGPAVVPQLPELGISVVQVPGATEIAGIVVAQVVAIGGDIAVAVPFEGLFARMVFWSIVVPSEIKLPPVPCAALFPLRVLLLIVIVPALMMASRLFPVMVLLLIVTVPC
jgi:hypothetical protein